jgi:hypothetical protein
VGPEELHVPCDGAGWRWRVYGAALTRVCGCVVCQGHRDSVIAAGRSMAHPDRDSGGHQSGKQRVSVVMVSPKTAADQNRRGSMLGSGGGGGSGGGVGDDSSITLSSGPPVPVVQAPVVPAIVVNPAGFGSGRKIAPELASP